MSEHFVVNWATNMAIYLAMPGCRRRRRRRRCDMGGAYNMRRVLLAVARQLILGFSRPLDQVQVEAHETLAIWTEG